MTENDKIVLDKAIAMGIISDDQRSLWTELFRSSEVEARIVLLDHVSRAKKKMGIMSMNDIMQEIDMRSKKLD